MEKEMGTIRFFETDDGFRVEVKGEKLSEAMKRLGIKVACCAPADCCPPEGKKKE